MNEQTSRLSSEEEAAKQAIASASDQQQIEKAGSDLDLVAPERFGQDRDGRMLLARIRPWSCTASFCAVGE